MQTRQVKSNSPSSATKAPEPAQTAVVKGGAATLVPAWASTQNDHVGLADVQKERTGETKETTRADMPAKEQPDTKKLPIDTATTTTTTTTTSTAEKKEGEEAIASSAAPTQPVAANPQGDPHFQAVISKLDKSAEKTKTHPPAKKKVASAHAAAVPPANEKQAGAQAKQVGVMNNAEVKKPEPQSFLDLLRTKIDQIMPKKLGDTETFMKGGEKQQLKDTMTGNVNQQKEEAAGGIKSATSQAPDASQVEGKQVTPLPTETTPTPSPIGAAGAVPSPKAESEVSLNQGKQEADQSLKQANVTPEQLQKANDPRFSAVITAKGAVDKQADAAPQKYRVDEQKTIAQAAAKAVSDEKQGLGALHGQRGKADASVMQGQQDAKGNDEKARQEVTNNIEKIYTETKQTVEGKLNSLETDVSAMFDKGIEGAMTRMTDYVNGRMDAYKDERYSGILGKGRWLKDLLLDLPDEVNVFYTDGLKVFRGELDTLIVSIANTVETRLKEAKDEINNGQKRISDYVKGLDKSLQTVGEAAEKAIAGRFDEMRQSVDDKKNDLADKLAQRYKEAYDKAGEKLKEMQAENKGLLTVLKEKVGEVIKILIEFKERILGMLKSAEDTIDLIVADPIAFLKNLLAAIKKGLHQFVDNIWTHLKAGFMAWLFGTLADAGIQIPQEFSLGSILKLVLQILGLTYERIRGKAVKLIGERNVSLIEKAWSIISTLITGGPEALWEQIKEFLGNLKQMVVDSIQDWIVTTIVKSAITKLVSMFNPVGAIIQAIVTIYDVVMFLVGNINKILDFVQSIINSVHKIAVGDIDSAANWIEQSLAKTIPLIISFLADLLGLGGLSEKIKTIIEKIQGTVDKAIDKVIDKIVKGIGKLFGKGKKEEEPEKTDDPEHDAKVTAGLTAIDEEDARYVKDGKIEREDAEKVAVKVKGDHPVFKSITVVDGGKTWDYDYVASPGKKKTGKDKVEHRGRLQVQGKDLRKEISWPWAQATPPTATAALAGLDGMKAQLNSSELNLRGEAFEQAARFISNAQKVGGVSAPVSVSFQNSEVRKMDGTARVDIEVRKGKAFT